MRRAILTALAAILIVSGSAVAADHYIIDPAHSSIGFGVRHLGLSKVKGTFTEFSGTISYDPQDVSKSSVKVTIKAASINTSNQDRDNHLRSKDFFETEKYPEVTFVSEMVMKHKDTLIAHGTLTMHGVSKKIALPFTLVGPAKGMRGEMRMAVEAQTSLNRQDYGVSWSHLLDGGGLVVGNEIDVDIAVEAIQSIEHAK